MMWWIKWEGGIKKGQKMDVHKAWPCEQDRKMI
jgi:hypothetical protein